MANVSTLVYILEEERIELISINELFELEQEFINEIAGETKRTEYSPEPGMVGRILEKAGIT